MSMSPAERVLVIGVLVGLIGLIVFEQGIGWDKIINKKIRDRQKT